MKRKMVFMSIIFLVILLIGGSKTMADKNIQMGQRNADNTAWDNHYPITKAENVLTDNGTVASELEGKARTTDVSQYIKNRRNKAPLPNPNFFYDNFKNRLSGSIVGQAPYSLPSGGSANIVNGTLEIISELAVTKGLIVNDNFNEGKIRLLINASTNPAWLLSFRHNITNDHKYAIWRYANGIEFGWINPDITSQISTIPFPATGDYYVEVIVPTIYIGAVIEIRAWGVGESRPSTPSGTYTIASGDPIFYEKNVSVQSISGTMKISEIFITKGLNNTHKPLSQAYFSGRWANTIINGTDVMTTINQGAEIYAEVENTAIVSADFVINSTENPYIVYSIDGGVETRAQVVAHMPLFSSLSYGKHIIKIVVSGIQEADDVWNKGRGLCFAGFNISLGGTIKPYVPNNKPLLFIGDSITAGVNAFGIGAIPVNNSGEKAYPHICANLLGALPIQVGFGATGVTRGGSGNVPKAEDYVDLMMSDKYENAEFPFAIVVNHGTNDFGATPEAFEAAYLSLINKLKSKYPNVPIFCIDPLTTHTHYALIRKVAQENNCYYVDTASWNVTTTDGGHPDVNGHLIAGQKLAEFIKETLGEYYFY